MNDSHTNQPPNLLLLLAGAKGAIATTTAVATMAMKQQGMDAVGGLTSSEKFTFLGPAEQIQLAGWDSDTRSMSEALTHHGVLPEKLWWHYREHLDGIPVHQAPATDKPLGDQVAALQEDMHHFRTLYPQARVVLVNVLPACWDISQSHRSETIEDLLAAPEPVPPDLAYAVAALLEGIPIVNYTPNTIELPAICDEAKAKGVPMAGRDGKSGQTYLKVALASAFKARNLRVDGWYSLNILGNADGKNLMDPDRACGKLQNKTHLLDDILGYPVASADGQPTHKVHIDYYPPRGDAKEAWDVIDFSGLLGLPMSLRLNLQGRDSILAAPMVIDLARWMAAIHMAEMGGPIADLGFFFKKPVGPQPPLTFEDQITALKRLETQIHERVQV